MVKLGLLIALAFSIAGLLSGMIGQLGLCFIFFACAAVVMMSLIGRAGGSNPHLTEGTTKTQVRLVKKPSVASPERDET